MEDKQDKLIEYLGSFISKTRKDAIEKVLQYRTRQITVVLEDIFKHHNANAVIRTCECMGIQDLHVTEDHYAFEPATNILQGAAKWINLYRYNDYNHNNSEQCIRHLKNQGYQILIAHPDPAGMHLEEVSLEGKTALVFGSELDGISKTARELSDASLFIPLYGFTKSYNVSVSVALVLYRLIHKIRSGNYPWQLSNQEKKVLRLKWYKSTVRSSELLEKKFLESEGKE